MSGDEFPKMPSGVAGGKPGPGEGLGGGELTGETAAVEGIVGDDELVGDGAGDDGIGVGGGGGGGGGNSRGGD